MTQDDNAPSRYCPLLASGAQHPVQRLTDKRRFVMHTDSHTQLRRFQVALARSSLDRTSSPLRGSRPEGATGLSKPCSGCHLHVEIPNFSPRAERLQGPPSSSVRFQSRPRHHTWPPIFLFSSCAKPAFGICSASVMTSYSPGPSWLPLATQASDSLRVVLTPSSN